MQNHLTIQNLNYTVLGKPILKEISFTCTNGIIALLGNNGVGKTTLMRIIAGLKKANTGTILLDEISLIKHKPYPINEVGYLPQDFEIYGNITGYDFLSYVYDVKGLAKEQKKQVLEEIIDRFSLQTVIHKRFARYSGGFKRRLGIAQAVLGEPKLIIIDEPTAGLDPQQRIEFRRFLSAISTQAITLISTHIIEDVELLSDQLVVIGNDKKLIFDGEVKSLIAQAEGHIYTTDISRNQLVELRQQALIIEEARLTNDIVKVKYVPKINTSLSIEAKIEKEISLENAYLYFQSLHQ